MDNELWREMANLLCIAKFTISPGSPKSNGIVEKVQGLIVNAIKYQAVQYRIKPQDWASLAIWACLAHNATPFDNMEPSQSPTIAHHTFTRTHHRTPQHHAPPT